MAVQFITYGNTIVQYDDTVYKVVTAQQGKITFPMSIVKIADNVEQVQVQDGGVAWWKVNPGLGNLTTFGQHLKITLP